MNRTGAPESAEVTLDGETIQDTTATREWQTFQRVAPLELAEEGDGRTLYGRVVPYNVTATVADPPHYRKYQESFAPGAFRAQLQAANRIDVLLNYEHRQGITDVIGRGVSLEDQGDGLYGSFRILDHSDGDKALELVHAGALRGLSTEFSVRKSRTVDGVTQRIDARIANVALCREYAANFPGPKAAYEGAEVLAIRTTDVAEPVNNDLHARLVALGVDPDFTRRLRAITRKPWDDSPTRFTDDEYARSCLVCRAGDAPTKTRCSLPVLEPNGDVNVTALGQAAARINQTTGLSADERATAARKLRRYYTQASMPVPPRIDMMAGA